MKYKTQDTLIYPYHLFTVTAKLAHDCLFYLGIVSFFIIIARKWDNTLITVEEAYKFNDQFIVGGQKINVNLKKNNSIQKTNSLKLTFQIEFIFLNKHFTTLQMYKFVFCCFIVSIDCALSLKISLSLNQETFREISRLNLNDKSLSVHSKTRNSKKELTFY